MITIMLPTTAHRIMRLSDTARHARHGKLHCASYKRLLSLERDVKFVAEALREELVTLSAVLLCGLSVLRFSKRDVFFGEGTCY